MLTPTCNFRPLLFFPVTFLLVTGFFSSTFQSRSLMSQDLKSLQTTLSEYCYDCHGGGQDEGGIDLEKIKNEKGLLNHAKLIERIIGAVSDRHMPPQEEAQPGDDKRRALIKQLEGYFDQAARSQPFIATPIRRMNRFQYNNAVVDLFELDRDIFQMNERLLRRRSPYFNPAAKKMPDELRVSSRPLSKDIDNQRPEGFRGVVPFPQDKRAEHGFDNRGDHLTLSPLLMESFLKLSQSISESPDLNPRECGTWTTFFADPKDATSFKKGSRYEAEDASRVKVQLATKGPVGPQGMSAFNGKWSGDSQLFWRTPNAKQELALVLNIREPGTGLRLGMTKAGDYGKFDIFLDDKKIGNTVDLYARSVIPSSVTLKNIALATGKHSIRFKCVGKNPKSTRHFFGLDYVEILGVQPKRAAKPEKESQEIITRRRIQRLLRMAFRKPADPEIVDRFTSFAKKQLDAGRSYEETMRTIAGATIGMPDFLYIYEKQIPERLDEKTSGIDQPLRQPVDDYELATRLSQFFWSSIPDKPLLDLADQQKLSNPDVLSAQIDRMLNDKKIGRFCDNFAPQWLQLDRLITSIPDKQKFPYFYFAGYRTSMHMMSEPLLLFETVLVEDRNVMDLIDPGFTYQSNMLKVNYSGHAKAGGEVQVQTFRRTTLDDPRRGGVIANAAVMTMTSTPTRTQPITRGAWINEVIFNDPPEPPPADVPPLPEVDKAELEKLTIRERLAIHRKRSDCAGCHNKIDPLGFALENYGPTGVWRDKYENGRQVDVSGKLFNQFEFNSMKEFKQIIVREKHRFIRAFAAHLLSYALSRELGPADSPTLDEITRKALQGEDSMRTILKNIAMSEPFLHKR